jgi:hypothetical protein
MEDPINGVFYKEPNQVIYKQLLTMEETDDLNSLLTNRAANLSQDGALHLCTGFRKFIDIDLNDSSMSFITDRLRTTLFDYFSDLEICKDARFYSHEFGRTKPHKDGNHDGVSNYTLLLYLTDEFDDGKLSIKMKRSDEEKRLVDSNMHHKVFKIIPRKGYGVIFDKNLMHWADEVYEGCKNFLLIHLYSCF